MADLTPKQEKFAQCVASGMTYSDSYRESYSAENSKPETINENASRVMSVSKVLARVDAIRSEAVQEIKYGIKECFNEFDDVRERAKKDDNFQVEIKAIENKGKLNKLFVDQKEDLTDYSGLLKQLGEKAS